MSAAQGSRRGLRPDTFPFLAVLLCAMGALILLLLVMDRRAKAVARAKAMQAAARVAEEDAKRIAARQEEWEQRRAVLRAALLMQAEEVQGEIRETQALIGTAATSLQAEQARKQELNARLNSQQLASAERTQALAREKDRATEADRQTGAIQAARVRLAAELEQVQRTIADLKTLRQRQQQTYSVVPYRGKHGENRRPLYVEITSGGLIFHPDRTALSGLEVTPLDIRTEVEKRVTRQKATMPGGNTKPYLLLLVRPDGVPMYYRTQAALVGLEADFGYELIDADWILEFPEQDSAAQPWMSAGRRAVEKTVAPKPGPAPRGMEAAAAPTVGSVGNPHGSASGQAGGVGASAAPKAMGILGPSTATTPGVQVPNMGSSGAVASPAAVLAPPTILGTPSPAAPRQGGSPSETTTAPREADGAASGTRPAPRGLPPGEGTPAPRRSGTRDWVIAIECRRDTYVVYPGATRIALDALTSQPGSENPLARAIQQELTPRPDRPHVRFLVRPDGARAYYRAFPLLESLGVPMTRQNLDAEEPVGLEHLTR